MQKIELGKTGLQVARLGFGGIPIQRIDKEGTRSLFLAMKEAGINYIDTARAYTVSEEYIGYAMEGMRENFVLATKSMARTREAMEADIQTSLKNLRTDYIDIYQVHNPDEAAFQKVTAPGGALEALLEAKKKGIIGHIGLTAHSLAVARMALETDWVETLMFPYNIVENQGSELITLCREKGVGFLAMKPFAGGAIESGKDAVRYIASQGENIVILAGMASENEIAENKEAMEDTSPISSEEEKSFEEIRQKLGTVFCRRCNYCQPCTVGISISNVFLFEGYLERYDLEGWARSRYATLNKKASECIECGVCETRCPYHLPIRQLLKKAAKAFGE